jgi:hypothetical protein
MNFRDIKEKMVITKEDLLQDCFILWGYLRERLFAAHFVLASLTDVRD